MADIEQAAKWMQEGRKVIRKQFSGYPAAYSEEGIVSQKIGDVVHLFGFELEDLLADDWELAD